MATMTLIYGQSGTGKSTSLRNFSPDEVAIINVSGKPLPFRSARFKTFNTDDYSKISAAIKQTDRNTIIIDDATYLMTNEYMRNAKVTGYQKFMDLALNFFNLVKFASSLPDEKTIYFIGHSEKDGENGEKFKTIGKMLDSTITLEGLFTIVLKTVVKDGKYYFQTQNNGNDTCKSPIGLFDEILIENDLKKVDEKIREYWGF